MSNAYVGVGLDVKGARVGLPLTSMEGCDPKELLPGLNEEAWAHVAFSERIVPLVVNRGIWLRSALRALLRTKISTADCRGIIMSCVQRWAHAEMRSSICWGPRSRHEPLPVGGNSAVVGSGRERAAKGRQGRVVYVTIYRMGKGERPHMYRLMGYREVGPRR